MRLVKANSAQRASLAIYHWVTAFKLSLKGHGAGQVLGTTQGEKMRMISDERLYEGLFKFT